MTKKRPDVVVFCEDGHERVVIRRYRWLASQGLWASRKQPTMLYPGNTPIRSGGVGEGPVPERDHHELRCGTPLLEQHAGAPRSIRCGQTVPARDERLQFVLTVLSHNGVPEVSLAGLRTALTESRG